MSDLLLRIGALRLASAGLALCLACSPGLAMTGMPGDGYGTAARPANVWRAQPGKAKAISARSSAARLSAAKPLAAKSLAAKTKQAETKPAKSADAKAAGDSAPTEPSSAWTSGEQDRACFRSRRKLWQDGEGWVVKKVSVCP